MDKKNKNFIVRLLVAVSILCIMVQVVYFTNSNCSLKNAACKGAYMEVNGRDINNKIYALDGQWNYYPQIFLGQAIRNKEKENPVSVEVPKALGKEKDIRARNSSYGSYEINIIVEDTGQYMLSIPYISSAYRLYINGEYIGGVGTVGKNSGDERGAYHAKNYLFTTKRDLINIVIEVSNFTCVKGGIIDDIYFGTVDNISKYTMNKTINDTLTVGMLIAFGVFPLLLLNKDNKVKSGVFFTGFCFSSAVFAFLIKHNIGGIHFFEMSLSFLVKAEFCSLMIMLTFIYEFLKLVYPYDKKKDRTKFILIVNLIYLIGIFHIKNMLVFKLVGNLYSLILLVNALVSLRVIVRSMKEKKRYAIFSFMGIMVFLLLGLVEIFALETGGAMRLYLKDNLYNIGLLFFVLCHINIFLMDIDQAYENAALADRMEISFLHAQIAPHFLFNTLNNLFILMDQDLKKAKDLLINLTDFLKVKYKFDYRKMNDYKLRDEVDFLKSYTAIENYRRDGKVKLHFYFEDQDLNIKEEIKDSLNFSFQPMILQPLVENSIRHGFRSEILDIIIHVKKIGKYLEFIVEDNGAGMPDIKVKMLNKAISKGVGISNINYRLSKNCGEKLHFESEIGQGTKISFKYRMEEAA